LIGDRGQFGNAMPDQSLAFAPGLLGKGIGVQEKNHRQKYPENN